MGDKGNQWIAQQLIDHTLRTVRRTGLPVFRAQQQSGSSFGERLANAVEQVFAHGHQEVIIVGNDSPDLSLGLLHRAAKALQTQSMVIGPAQDGGSYLIGLSLQSYQRKSFIQLAWETDQLCVELLAYVAALGQSAFQLPPLCDIDSAQDLRKVWQQLPQWHRLRIQLSARFHTAEKPATILYSLQRLRQLTTRALRGPPNLLQRASIG